MSVLQTQSVRRAQWFASLSIIMPAHNEERTISSAVEQVLNLDAPWPFELIVVDDGSSDATSLELAAFYDPRLIVLRHEVNQGKGAAVLTGARQARGTHLVVFDADCEYRAEDLARMFEVVIDGKSDVVYGARVFDKESVSGPVRYTLGRRLMTSAANMLFDASLTDLHTCLKMMPVQMFRRLNLSENGFGLDSEITAELLRRGHRPLEVPVSYVGRSHAEGKKITWRDGVDCFRVLAKVRLRGVDQPVIVLPDVTRAPLAVEPSLA